MSLADIVREKSVLRQLLAVANDIADSVFQSEGRLAAELLDLAESKVFAIAEQTAREGGPEDIKTLVTKAAERIDMLSQLEGSITGLATGYADFDEMRSSFQAM